MKETTASQFPASVASEGRSTPAQGLDLDAATSIANETLRLHLGTTRRTEIAAQTGLLTQHLSKRVAAASRPGADQETCALYQEARSLLERPPETGALVASEYAYMKALARVLRRVIALEEGATGEGEEAIPLTSFIPHRSQPDGTYRVPSGLGSFGRRLWPTLYAHGGPG